MNAAPGQKALVDIFAKNAVFLSPFRVKAWHHDFDQQHKQQRTIGEHLMANRTESKKTGNINNTALWRNPCADARRMPDC